MKILVTGSKGFIGKNLVAELANLGHAVYTFDKDTEGALLSAYARACEFVFHLGVVNQPKGGKRFSQGSEDFTVNLLSLLRRYHNPAPIVITSSIQAERGNPYGISKKAVEDLMFTYSKYTGVKTYVYRLPNLFGKWSKPYFNSVVATYCHSISRNLKFQLEDVEAPLCLCYIDDVLEEFVKATQGRPTREGAYCKVPVTYTIKSGELADKIKSFRASRSDLTLPKISDPLTQKLYSTYLSFLPVEGFSYPLNRKGDQRGWVAEFLKIPDLGQISINITKPGIIKGNHWHHSKIEKFLVVSGEGVIRFRKIGEGAMYEYKVSGRKLEVVDIVPGYIHNIENTGETDLVTVIWVNEAYNLEKPDTYSLEV